MRWGGSAMAVRAYATVITTALCGLLVVAVPGMAAAAQSVPSRAARDLRGAPAVKGLAPGALREVRRAGSHQLSLVAGHPVATSSRTAGAAANLGPFGLSPASGPTGIIADLTQVGPCPAPTTGDTAVVTAWLVDSSGRTVNGVTYSIGVRRNGNWNLGNGQEEFWYPTGQNPELNFAAVPPGSYSLNVGCYEWNTGPPVETGAYQPQTFTVTGPAQTINVSSTTVAQGGTLQISPAESCAPYGPEANVYGVGGAAAPSVDSSGMWGPVTISVPTTEAPGVYYMYASCGDYGSYPTYSQDPLTGPALAYGPVAITVTGDGSLSVSLKPASASGTVGQTHKVTAQLVDSSTNAAVPGAKIGFTVIAGPNAGAAGACIQTGCNTNSTGHVSWTYTSNGQLGVDTVEAFYDTNGNGQPDPGEPETTATMTWLPPTTSTTSPHWAGYVLTQGATQSLASQVVVPSVPSSCARNKHSASWIGYNGFTGDTSYLPQIGFDADCSAPGHGADPCTNATGASYYLWWEINPHIPLKPICSIPFGPGDKVDLDIQRIGGDIYFHISVLYADGTSSEKWSKKFTPKNPQYNSMECIVEAPFLTDGSVALLANFDSVRFNGCTAIEDYAPGATLHRMKMQPDSNPASTKATVGPITVNQNGFSHFVVTWKHS